MPDRIFPYGRGAMLFLILLAPALFTAANDWLYALCADLILLLLALVWLSIARHFQIPDLWTLLARAPRWIRCIVYVLLMLCGAGYAVYTTWRSAYFLTHGALKLLPVWFCALALLIICWFIEKYGAPALFLWAIPTAWIVGLVTVLSLVLSLPDWHMSDFSAPLSFSPLFGQVVDGLPILFSFLLFTGFDTHLPQKRAIVLGGIFATVLSGLTILRADAVLGTNCARMINYPAYAAAGVFEAGALARGEVIFGCVFLLCLIAHISLSICVLRTAYQALREQHT